MARHYSLCKQLPKKDKRQARWKKQRKKRGFDDTELWNLNTTIATFILPRLKAFRKGSHGYPYALKNVEAWNKILDQMIEGFEQYVQDDINKIDYEKTNKALDLFSEWFNALWY
jgi:hypothetical protein